ncbi:MAG: gliding motility protein, partial [Planctomycetes bacterium]|nr:gliding motility protein [Planctomycetota bacterium]
AWRRAEDAARTAVQVARQRHGPDGVSVDTVYALDTVERCLRRMGHLVAILTAEQGPQADAALRRLCLRVAVSVDRDRSLRRLARDNLRLLHQRIIQRAGETGEHYVARNAADYRLIWLQAAGGGLLTAVTAAFKVAVHQLAHAIHLAPAAAGFLAGLNYAVSFVALQHLHLILATKQPAMTAAALASTMQGSNGDERHERMVDETARIASSQLAAAAANVIVVAIAAAAFDAGWRALTGRHWMDAAEAADLYLSLSPVDSLTAFYAALTGVILWLSSLFGGWFDNWVRLHRIPDGLEGRRAGWGAALRKHAAGWGTNISLGFMLGMTPAIGQFLGLPLDVRHVTLNTGILSLALSGLGHNWFADGLFLRALAGIAVMFVLNLGVSFALSFATALRAYQHPRDEATSYLRCLLRRALRRPWQFILPTSR